MNRITEDNETEQRKVRRHLPMGTGPFSVGTVDIMCDHTEEGSFFRLYYPTTKTDILKRDKQWPLWLPRKEYGLGYAYFLGRNLKLFGKLFNWMGGDVYVPALWQAPVLRNGQKFPVVVLSHGLGGNRTTNTTYCLELASRGFVVAALEHRDGSASMTLCLRECWQNMIKMAEERHSEQHNLLHRHHSVHHRNSVHEEWKWFDKAKHLKWDDFTYRNKQVHQRATECSRILDILFHMNEGKPLHNALGITFDTVQFKNTLDLSKPAVIGHSFGGSTCICTLSKDKRFLVGIVLDGWMHPLDDSVYKNITQPLLLVNMETFQWKKNVQQMKQLDRKDVERIMMTIKGTCHQSVTDFQFLINKPFGRFMQVRHTLSPSIAMEISCKATLEFLYKHLGIIHCNHGYLDDILNGKHELVIPGTNLDLS